MTIAGELAGWALSLDLADVPTEVRHAACRHVLDGIGCAVAAARCGAASAARGTVGRAFELGVLVHALDFDDTHAGGLVHATAPVLPVMLSEGVRLGVSGAEALTAAIAGMETICRLGAAAPHAFHARGLHATAVCGVFASALTAARLRGLLVEQTVNALGIAGSRAGGLLEFLDTGASTKQLHPGFAAQDGIVIAALAAADATGPATVFEGRYGVYRALIGRDPDRAALLGGLGEDWEITRITVKPYPACQLLHAQLDAARELRDSGLFDGPPIQEIVVEVHPDAVPIVCGRGKERPRSSYEAKFSLPWSVAAMIVDGAVTVRTYDHIDRPDVLEMAALVRPQAAEFGGAAADQPGRVRARLGDGRWVMAAVPRSRGGPGDPGIAATVRDKALANLGGDDPEGIAEMVLALDAQPSLKPLMKALESHGL
ncbi:MmgE/PrpD family protein [Actinomadura barringtoniae]|uniref:MmgE/PrpD family protein n=1 Tax=Actinomadura barringtoniae TaxID=1427535 RepID=A0A939T3B0_9ACTN|nr:MmgE/PrpD family protein [Actinomadura barringtoniae]MBO2447848.1 MmgE/PrpD family protein [Actinomadura barringtoniae]